MFFCGGGWEGVWCINCYLSIYPRPPGGSRSQHAAVKRRECVLVSGGLDHDLVLDTLLEFGPEAGVWREVGRMPGPRADHAMVVYQDIVYLVGGWRDGGEGRQLVAQIDR